MDGWCWPILKYSLNVVPVWAIKRVNSQHHPWLRWRKWWCVSLVPIRCLLDFWNQGPLCTNYMRCTTGARTQSEAQVLALRHVPRASATYHPCSPAASGIAVASSVRSLAFTLCLQQHCGVLQLWGHEFGGKWWEIWSKIMRKLIGSLV